MLHSTYLEEIKLESKDSTIILVGAGNQAKAWAKGLEFTKTPYRFATRGLKDEIDSFEIGPDLKKYKNFCLLIPDTEHLNFLQTQSEFIPHGTNLFYAHGHSVSKYQLVGKFPQWNHILLAPKSIGREIINNLENQKRTPCVYSFEGITHNENESKAFTMDLIDKLYFNSICEVKFKEEVIADLYSEQALLCGLYPYIIHEVFKVLQEAGIPSKLSFLECWHESKLIMNALIEAGPEKFFDFISPNALMGANFVKDKLIDDQFRNKLKSVLNDLKDDSFENYLDTVDYQKTKNEIKEFWRQSDIQKNYSDLSPDLY